MGINEIKFEPYWGSLKGAMGALYAKAGGSTDQASLLIALLRASNIPARYVRGTIRIQDATNLGANGRAPRWIGAKSYAAAESILWMGRYPSTSVTTNGINAAHVWVEACVPYGNYRGTKIDKTGHRWIALDPSFKDKRYQPGITTSVNFDYSGTAGTFMAKRSPLLPHEFYENQVQASIKTLLPNFFNNTLAVPYTGKQEPLDIDILPASLPYEVTQFTQWDTALTAEVAALPDKHRYKFAVTTGSLSSILSLPKVALQRITLSYRGAAAADVTNLDAWKNNGDFSTATVPCTTDINVIPSLKVEGVEVAAGSTASSVKLCTNNNNLALTVSLQDTFSTTINSVTFTNIGAANYHALQGYAFQASDRLLSERVAKLTASVRATSNPNGADSNQDETEGEFLNVAVLKYMRYITDAGKRIGGLDGTSGESGNHIGLTSTQAKVQYFFDLPFAIYRTGFLMDLPGGQSRGLDLITGGANYKSFVLTGYTASNYESHIWQETARLDAVSTVRGIQFAREQSIEVLTLTAGANWSVAGDEIACANPSSPCYKLTHNANAALNYSTTALGRLKAAVVDQGMTVTAPRSYIQYPDANPGNWTGAVYVSEKNALPTSASIGFLISGGYAGGYSVGNPFLLNAYNTIMSLGSIPPPQIPAVFTAPPSNPTSAGSFSPAVINNTTGANGSNNYQLVGGDPVNLYTGNLYHTERDLALKGRGALPIVFERSYNSRFAKDGPLGFGWTHSFNHKLRFYGVEGGLAKLSWTDGTGGEKFFSTTLHTSGNITLNSAIPRPTGIFVDFTRQSDGAYTVREKNGLTYTFESVNATATDTGQVAKLLNIRDRNNNTITLTYIGTQLATVADLLGRSLTFTYQAGRIFQISDWTGRTFQYDYDGGGNLWHFNNPLALALTQAPMTYTYYSDTTRNHLMQSYTLPKGNGMNFEYYMNGKVFRHTTFPLKETNTFTYNEFRREVVTTNERGYTRRHLFDSFGNPIKIIEENGATRSYTYDCPNYCWRALKFDQQEGLVRDEY